LEAIFYYQRKGLIIEGDKEVERFIALLIMFFFLPNLGIEEFSLSVLSYNIFDV